MGTNEKYLRAKKRVEQLKRFDSHLAVYIVVNAFIFGINVYHFQGTWWFIYPLLGWGIGIVLDGISVWTQGRQPSDWEARKIQEYMAKDDDND